MARQPKIIFKDEPKFKALNLKITYEIWEKLGEIQKFLEDESNFSSKLSQSAVVSKLIDIFHYSRVEGNSKNTNR